MEGGNSPNDVVEVTIENYLQQACSTNMTLSQLQVSQHWVPDLGLKTRDKAIIEKGGLLTDQHVHTARKVLAEQFPHLQGLQSTLLVQTGSLPLCLSG